MKKKVLVIAAIIAVLVCILVTALIPRGHTHTPSAELTVVKTPTCATPGVAHTLCTDCGEVLEEVALPATGKHIGEPIPEIPATCTSTGLTAGEKCVDCGATLVAQQEIPVLAHTYDDKYDANCNVCDHTRDVECRHNNVETLKKVDPTCTAAGKTEGKKCKTCGEVLTAQTLIEKLPHTYSKAVTAPTCAEKGYTTYTCACGDSYVADYVNATGEHIYDDQYDATCNTCDHTRVAACRHDDVETLKKVDPTCTTAGKTEGKKCKTCGEVLIAQTLIEKLPHTYSKAVTAPTCAEKGYTTYTCACGDSYVADYVNATGEHIYDDQYDATCNTCDHTRVAACRHDDVETLKKVEPTCTTAGKTEGKKCKTCGEVLTAQTLIEKLPHTYSKAVTAPTCAEKGYTTYTCACGDSYVSDCVNATGKHTYSDGVCTGCGTEHPDTKAKREAEKAYADYKAKNGGKAPEYMLYQSGNRFVALHKGTAKGVYNSNVEALKAMLPSADGSLLFNTGDGKLWAYHLPTWDTDGDGTLSILAIGNSFSVDALEYVYQIAQNLGIEDIVIGNLYRGGCNLATHVQYAKNETSYTGNDCYYNYNDDGTWNKSASTSKAALQSRSWDFVMLQQVSSQSGQVNTYNENLDYMIAYVKEYAPNARLVWHMTWAYQQDSNHSAFPNYGKNQMTMYNAIVDAVKNRIQTNVNFDFIVPNGTAVQNSRTSILGDTTTRDGYHMSYNYGRYLTGLLFVKTLTGLSVDDITYVPDGVTDLEKRISIESVNNAHTIPFAVTKSNYSKESYMAIDLELFRYGYWNSNEQTNFNTIISNASNSNCYFATKQFTKEYLPLGSVILLKKGWQYRPEAWVDDRRQTSRNGITTQSYVVITEEWWGSYMKRAFNISKVNAPALSGVDESEINAAFQIYIPIQ